MTAAIDLDVSPPADDHELTRFASLASLSLGFPVERGPVWLARIGARQLRLARRDAEVVGGLGLLPMGHWFGGRAVPCVGVSAVAVAPEHRSRGIASEMMRTVLEEMRRDGVALSSLYAATFPVYRAAGYESAGNRFVYRVPLTGVGAGAREPDVRTASPEELPLLRALYDARARAGAAFVERSAYFWQRVLEPWEERVRIFVVEGAGGPEGYAVLWYKANPDPPAPSDVHVRDAVVRTSAAARRVLRLLADHRSVARTASLMSGPGDALLLATREERVEITKVDRLLVRVVDVRAALEQRGWSPLARGEVHLDVRDGVLRDNARRWTLEVSGGRAEVREGGSGAVSIDVRGLAALYTGYLPAEELRVAGLCDGSDADLATATALFAGPAPWTPDMF